MSAGADSLERVAVALDTGDWDEFRSWCELFGPRVGVLKVGLEAFARWGPEAVGQARRWGRRVFLDLKLHDIPNTVAGAVAACGEMGADYLTVHAAGGPDMLTAARESAGKRIALLAVTLLTHLDRAALDSLDLPGESSRRVSGWAALARRSGCAGVICSPLELSGLRRENPRPFLLVSPGIRARGPRPPDDQRRTASAAEAVAAGADLLVVGRPLTRAADPDRALAQLAKELES